MDTLVEVHDEDGTGESRWSWELGSIGINNRDLHRFTLTWAPPFAWRPRIPAGHLIVSESGIRDADQVRQLRAAGVHAMLVGEVLMAQADAGARWNDYCD